MRLMMVIMRLPNTHGDDDADNADDEVIYGDNETDDVDDEANHGDEEENNAASIAKVKVHRTEICFFSPRNIPSNIYHTKQGGSILLYHYYYYHYYSYYYYYYYYFSNNYGKAMVPRTNYK